ncbi:AlpA family phage regulatory protein [Mesorhizobium sp. B2-4-14]|uniref:helix-turn-helix transcriptional regulator n=1 Tax=Mesorhizobium sp. B2-4-14 TaxID=2589935 RepID=UPI001AEEE7A7|nr:AlpA family phage regulatory protein [Mesorhizobium sp. B2-4-14]
MRVLGYDGLKAKGIPYSKPHLWRLCKAGKFPRPVKLGENRIAFVEDEIDAWLAQRVAERDSAEAA